MAIGQGAIIVNQRRNGGGGGGTVNAANEGLKLFGGNTVQLGDSNATDNLAQITAGRYITGFNATSDMIRFQSDASVTPATQFNIRANGIGATRLSGGDIVFINMFDGVTNEQTFIYADQVEINGTPGPAFVVNGENIGGAVFASNFRNTNAAANASVVSQWYVDSVVEPFQIIKEANADGGDTILQQISNTANSALILRSDGTTPRLLLQINADNVATFNADEIAMGDLTAAATGAQISISAVDATFEFFTTASSGPIFILDQTNEYYRIGDIAVGSGLEIDASNGLTRLGDINDAGTGIILFIDAAANRSTIQDTASTDVYLDINPGGGFYRLGLDAVAGESYLTIENTVSRITFHNSAIRTGTPSGLLSLNEPWELGDVENIVVTGVDATQAVNVVIAGVAYRLAIATV